jgi:WD40 repeat protein
VRLWNTNPASADFAKEIRTFEKKHVGPVWSLLFIQHVVEKGGAGPLKVDVLISGGADGQVVAWDPQRGAAMSKPVFGHGGGVLSLAPLQSMGHEIPFLSSGSDRRMKIWKMPGPHSSLATRAHGGPITAVAADRGDFEVSATGGWDGSIKIWNTFMDNYERLTLTGHVGPVRALVFTNDRRLLISAGQDGTVRLWRAAARE